MEFQFFWHFVNNFSVLLLFKINILEILAMGDFFQIFFFSLLLHTNLWFLVLSRNFLIIYSMLHIVSWFFYILYCLGKFFKELNVLFNNKRRKHPNRANCTLSNWNLIFRNAFWKNRHCSWNFKFFLQKIHNSI